jgi:MFS family permease
MHRSIFLTSIAVAAAFAIWLAVTGTSELNAWAIFTGHHCSVMIPGSSPICSSSYGDVGRFSSVNAALCGVLPALLGLVLGAPLVATEMQLFTNRLAWTQSITRTRWLVTKVGVGALITGGIVGALAPLFWWWSDAAQRSLHIAPSNFDISGFVIVSYALFAFMLGVVLGALIRRTGWAFAVNIPLYIGARLVVQDFLRPMLVAPVIKVISPNSGPPALAWILRTGFVPIGRFNPAPGQAWNSYLVRVVLCQGANGIGKPAHSWKFCEALYHVHDVVQFQPESHFWALQAGESAIFLGAAIVLLGVTVVAVKRWRT